MLKLSQSGQRTDLCDAGAVLYRLSYQANWELVVTWVNYKRVDVEIDDDNTDTSYVVELSRLLTTSFQCFFNQIV